MAEDSRLTAPENRWIVILVFAGILATVGFFLIDSYNAYFGILWTVMHGTILGTGLEYKWIAALSVCLAGYAIFLRATQK
jgi:hypothetical protein